jgi:hypothetical protein
MNEDNCNPTIRKSSSLHSLNTQSSSDNSILTSTTIQDTTPINPFNQHRRKAIIPTPNRPTHEQNPSTMSSKKDTSMSQQTRFQTNNRDASQDKERETDPDNQPHKSSDMSGHVGVDYSVASSTITDESNHDYTISKSDKPTVDRQDIESSQNVDSSKTIVGKSVGLKDTDDQSQPEDNANEDNSDAFILQKDTTG